MIITESHEEKIEGTLFCYDRININCTAGAFGYAAGMKNFFYTINRRCFDFSDVFKPTTELIKENANKIAAENNMEIEYINNVGAFRKDDKIAEIISERGEAQGLIKIYSQKESCGTYKPWTDKKTRKTTFVFNKTVRLCYYFYFHRQIAWIMFCESSYSCSI
jgi:hypothetical protein